MKAMFMYTVMDHPNLVKETTHQKQARRKSRTGVYPWGLGGSFLHLI